MKRLGCQSISSTMNGEKQYIMATATRLKRVNNVYTRHTRENKRIFVCVRLPFFLCLFICLLARCCFCCFAWIYSVRTRHVNKQHGLLYSWYEHQPIHGENETQKAFSSEHHRKSRRDKKKIHIIIVSSKEEHAISNVMKMFMSSYFVWTRQIKQERKKKSKWNISKKVDTEREEEE